MSTLEEQQVDLERDAVANGATRYMDALRKEEERGRTMDTPVAERMLKHHVRKLVPVLMGLQVEAKALTEQTLTSGRRPSGWEWRVQSVSPEVLSYITVKACVTAPYANDARRLQSVALRVGQAINNEVWWNEARVEERKRAKDTGEYNRIEQLKRHIKEVGPRTIRKWMRVLDDLKAERWSNVECIRVGAVVLERVLPLLDDLVDVKNIKQTQGRGRTTEVKMVNLQPGFLEQLMEAHEQVAMTRPWLQPMIVPPVDWKVEEGGELTGGYLRLPTAGLKSGGVYSHTSIDGIPTEVLDAMNRIQRTPWAINRMVLSVATEAFAYDMGPTPYGAPMAMPAAIADNVWDAMSKTEKGKAKAARALVYDHNFKEAEKKQSQARALSVASDFVDRDAIYFPHALDWRGRLYPVPQDLHPQATDFGKSLLRFAEAKPLGVRGVAWLEYHLANCYGYDKVDRAAQSQWVEDNHERIYGFALNPWSDLEFWLEADEPWQFLAAAWEYTAAHMDPKGPEVYESTLPVAIDGSCNGLQHLSAMGLDPVGAKAVNLLPGERQDIYQIVADKVSACVHEDALIAEQAVGDGSSVAAAWHNRVSRKTVKRGVMTTPYGVTPRGMTEQLKGSKEVKALAEETGVDRLKLSHYMRGLMQEAIAGTVVKANETMTWMQECADLLAEDDEGISWVTPVGLKVTQEYREGRSQEVNTVMGKLRVGVRNSNGAIKKTKQRNSIAPNIIHSFDAAHMMLTVLNMPEGTAFAMVHDSFGCHACDVDEMLETTKAAFVGIYREDWYENLKTDFVFFSRDRTAMVPAPEKGTLDIEQVFDSDYFFS